MAKRGSISVVGGFVLAAFAVFAIGIAIVNPPHPPQSAPLNAVQTVHADSQPIYADSPPPPPPAPPMPPTVPAPAIDDGFPRHILIPVQGASPKDIQDTFDQARGTERKHEATDILAPRGTPVLAVDDGAIKKLFMSKPGGITLYQFDPTEQYSYYYAHLDRYADGIREGMTLKQGDVIGYVGTTGNAPVNTPHLHFAIFKLGPDKRWWEGTPINPYPTLIRQAR